VVDLVTCVAQHDELTADRNQVDCRLSDTRYTCGDKAQVTELTSVSTDWRMSTITVTVPPIIAVNALLIKDPELHPSCPTTCAAHVIMKRK
jgi:hypothetical protein